MTGVPLRSDGQAMGALSVLVTTLMVALGILVLAGAASIRHIDLEWRQALTGRWTVELDPATDAAAAVTTLKSMPGVADAHALGPDEIRALLKPWLRDPTLAAELPLPVLIDLSLDRAAPPKPAAMARDLAARLPNAKLDDHGAWTGDLLRIARTGEVVGLAFFAAIALTMMVSIAATARARLGVNREEIALLHTIGASDGYIVRQFQAGALRSAVIGAFFGLVVAAGAMTAFIQNGPAVAPFAAQFQLNRIDWAVLACVPVAAVLLATAVAGLTARAVVRRLP
jgi:cell division transport system permease protein